MNSNQHAASAEAQEFDLFPCPFCGKSQLTGADHSPDCFFPLSERLKAATGADAFHLADKVSAAWRRRFSPHGHKVLPSGITNDVARNFVDSLSVDDRKVWNGEYGRTYVNLDPEYVERVLYPKMFEYLKSLHESPDSRPADAA